jgi:hypothetical protein
MARASCPHSSSKKHDQTTDSSQLCQHATTDEIFCVHLAIEVSPRAFKTNLMLGGRLILSGEAPSGDIQNISVKRESERKEQGQPLKGLSHRLKCEVTA